MPTPAGADHTDLLALAERLARGAGELTVRLRGGGRALDVNAVRAGLIDFWKDQTCHQPSQLQST